MSMATGVCDDILALARGAHARGALLLSMHRSPSVPFPSLRCQSKRCRRSRRHIGNGCCGTRPRLHVCEAGAHQVRAAARSGLEEVSIVVFGWPNEPCRAAAVTGAWRFEPGTPNLNGIVMAEASLEPHHADRHGTYLKRSRRSPDMRRPGLTELGLPLLTPGRGSGAAGRASRLSDASSRRRRPGLSCANARSNINPAIPMALSASIRMPSTRWTRSSHDSRHQGSSSTRSFSA